MSFKNNENKPAGAKRIIIVNWSKESTGKIKDVAGMLKVLHLQGIQHVSSILNLKSLMYLK